MGGARGRDCIVTRGRSDRDLPAGASTGAPPASTAEAQVALHMESIDDVGQTVMVADTSAAAGSATRPHLPALGADDGRAGERRRLPGRCIRGRHRDEGETSGKFREVSCG